MKLPLAFSLLSSVLILAGCSDGVRQASGTAAGDVVFHISGTEPLPPIGEMGSLPIELARFKVTAIVINRSQSSKWVFGDSVSSPFYGLYTRPSPSSEWEDERIGFCVSGTGLRELPAGHFTSFKLGIPASRIGSEARFGLTVFDSTDDAAGHSLHSNIITVGD